MGRRPHFNDSNTENRAAINVRNVEVDTWRDFKKLAVLHDMNIQDFLKYLVDQEKKRVNISISRK